MQDVLYSFDVFETILIRKTHNHHDIFSLMNKNDLVLKIFGKNFRTKRKFAEKKVRLFKREKCSIIDIYNYLGKKHKLNKTDISNLIELEMSTEIDNSFINKVINDKIENLINNCQKVILISDTIYPKELLRKLLLSKSKLYDKLDIYCSCDYGKEKKNYKLYKMILNDLKIDVTKWFHFGDNKFADYEIPKKMGINSTLLNQNKDYVFEKYISFNNEDLYKTYEIIKELRFNKSCEYSIGSSVAGPMVFDYVNWIINESIKKKIEHLYFVLRDGYILKYVADILIENRKLSIKTDFIFGSRIAWRFPKTNLEFFNNFSLWDKSNFLFRDPCYSYVCYERMGFPKTEIINMFGEDFSNKKINSFKEFKSSINEALKNESFKTKLIENINISKKNLILYLKQNINFNENFAFVDTNSTGKSQNDLIELLNEEGINNELKFFYHTFLSNDTKKDNQFIFINYTKDDVRFPEALFRAPYNVCYGYDNKKNILKPFFFNHSYCAWYGKFSYDDYLKGILDFCIAFENSNIKTCSDYSSLILDVVNFKIESKDLYQIFSKIPFNPDLDGAERIDFYPEVNFSSFFHPFSKLIYFPKGSYYCKNFIYKFIYKILFSLVSLKRRVK